MAACPGCGNALTSLLLVAPQDVPPDFNLDAPPPGGWYCDEIQGWRIGVSTRSPLVFLLVPFTFLWSGGFLSLYFGQSEARSKLAARKIFKSNDSVEISAFFDALRNKHIVHDENPFSDAFVALAVETAEPQPAAEVFASPIHLFIIDEYQISRSRQLVDTALTYVNAQCGAREKKIAAEYDQHSRDQLTALPDLEIRSPDSDAVFVTRGISINA